MKALLLCVCLLASRPVLADEISIHRMLTDGKILELAGTRPITSRNPGGVASPSISPDGKLIAYADADPDAYGRVRLARVSDGQSSVVLAVSPNIRDEGFVGELWEPEVSLANIAWSPDGKLFAVPVSHVTVGKGGSPVEFGIAVYKSTGARQTYFPLKDSGRPSGTLLWSPDSRRLACTSSIRRPEPRHDLLALDVSTGLVNVLLSRPVLVSPVLWARDGKTLQYTTQDGGKLQLREISIEDKSDQVVQAEYADNMLSPDRVFELIGPGISIKNHLTGVITEVIKTSPGQVLGWAPNSKMIVYQRSIEIEDEIGRRKRILNMTWLAATEANPLNHMCATFDSENGELPTWSKDCLKMAYLCDGSVCIAEFALRDPTVYEKLAAGIPLTEEEEKDVLMDNAKQIGAAMSMYASDNEGRFPSADSYSQDLMDYLRGANLFNRPGTDDMAFQYTSLGPMTDIRNPATTIMGSFDVGYQWKIILYADGHVQIVPK